MARPPTATDAVDAARRAVAAGDFAGALGHLGAVALAEVPEALREDPEGLEVLAAARYGSGHLEGAVAAWERAHEVHAGRGDPSGAAMAAAMVAMYLMMDTGLLAPVRGWLARADRLLADQVPGPPHAMVALVRMYERFMAGDLDAAAVWADDAVALGRAHQVPPAIVLGRVCRARVTILAGGDLEQGLRELDEVATVLQSGEVDPLTTGMVWCELVCALQGLGDWERAAQWTELMERWRSTHAFGGIHGRCRVHRAEVLRQRGDCREAEREALLACEELRPWMRREFGWPLAELGMARLRRGDLEGAHEALVAAHETAWDPQPGLALVHLAHGDLATAAALLDDALEHPVDVPSKEHPPVGDLRRAPLLEARVRVAVEAGDRGPARQALAELDGIVGRFASSGLAAMAATCRARVATAFGVASAEGDAVGQAERAVAAWADLGQPWEVADARLVLGRALRDAGSEPRARLELGAAASGFRRLGADLWADRAEALLVGAAPHPDPAIPGPARADPAGRQVDPVPGEPPGPRGDADPPPTFRRDGDTRTVAWAGRAVVLRDLKGMRHLERLLAEPRRELHVLDLVAAEEGGSLVDRGTGPLLDAEARRAYRRRLAECDQDVAEAEARNDLRRAEQARADRDWLLAELARGVGIGGRERTGASSAERARFSVTRAVRYAIDRIREHHPALADHLDQSVRTGTGCCYEPAADVTWRT